MTVHRRLPLVAALLLSLGTAGAAQAQDFPKRKPGLWEVSMEMPQAPGGGMKSQQCVDEQSDAAMQRRGLAGPGRDTECTHGAPKRIAGGVEIEADCTSKEGKSHAVARITGDMQSSYSVDTQVRFDPPRHGMTEARMTMKAQHAGACPAGMKGGDIRMGGMALNPAQGARPGLPGGIDPAQIANMTPEQRQQMLEALKKMRPQGQ